MRIPALLAALATALAPTLWTAAAAETWPSRVVTMVVPFPPGGGTDTGARIVAQKLGPALGPDGRGREQGRRGGTIGADLVAKAKPDGYTLLVGNIGTQSINPTLYPSCPIPRSGPSRPSR
jgi:tripartite-type tricarboxylate transporter receptor subunit TctC